MRKEYIQFSNFFFEFEEAVSVQKMYVHKEKYENENNSGYENEKNSDEEEEKQVVGRQNFGTLLHLFKYVIKVA